MPFVVYVMLLGYSIYTVSAVLIFAQCIKRHRARKIVERYYSEQRPVCTALWNHAHECPEQRSDS
jgi:hypothetical protein